MVAALPAEHCKEYLGSARYFYIGVVGPISILQVQTHLSVLW